MHTPVSTAQNLPVTSRARRWGIAAVLAATTLTACASDANKSESDRLAEQLLEESETVASNPTGSEDTAGAVPGGDDSTVSTGAGPSSGTGSSPGSGDVGQAPVARVAIDKTVWWGGFKITVDSAEGSSNALGSTINVAFAFENLTDDVRVLNRQDIVLTVGNQSYLSGLAQTPSVPAKGRNDAVLDFFVDDTFIVEDAVLTFGQPDTNQAVVPFGGQDATSFEPKVLQLDAQLVTPIVTVSLVGGSVEASYAPSESGKHLLRLAVEATYTGGSAGGDLILPTQFALRSPDGASFVAAPIAPGDVVAEPIYPGQDLTGKDAAFTIDDVATGTWTVTFTDSAGQSATADFVLE